MTQYGFILPNRKPPIDIPVLFDRNHNRGLAGVMNSVFAIGETEPIFQNRL